MNKKLLENELKQILKNCDLCHAKLCRLCPNNRRKKVLREKLKIFNKTFFQKIKEMLKRKKEAHFKIVDIEDKMRYNCKHK